MFDDKKEAMLKIMDGACRSRLAEIYPAGIPEDMERRFEREWYAMSHAESTVSLYVFYVLSQEAKKAHMPVLHRDTSHDSFLTYLLGGSLINPMDAYYYCEKCGHYERIADVYFGIDAAYKKCPSCGTGMKRDGFSLNEKFVWGACTEKDKQQGIFKEIYLQYHIPGQFLPFAERRLKEAFPDYQIVWALTEIGESDFKGKRTNIGFAILPAGKTLDDYPEQRVYLDDGKPAYYNAHDAEYDTNVFVVNMKEDPLAERIYHLQQSSGIYFREISLEETAGYLWRDIINTGICTSDEAEMFMRQKPKSCYEMAEMLCAVMDFLERIDGFCSRETLLHTLVNMGNDETDAYRMAEFVRTGRAATPGSLDFGDRWKALQNNMEIPSDVIDICEKCRYLCSQSSVLDYLLGYAVCAYYQKRDSKAYHSAMSPEDF